MFDSSAKFVSAMLLSFATVPTAGFAADRPVGIRHPVLNHGIDPNKAAAYEKAVERVVAMSEREMLTFMPERHYARFCECPKCYGGVQGYEIFEWRIERPDELKCKFCGTVVHPNPVYPEDQAMTGKNKSTISRFSRTLATMSSAGVPLVEALQSVAGATGNVVYSDAVLRMQEDVATGQSLQLAMKQRNLFPNMVIQMVSIGEESGALDDMLNKVANFYEEQVDNAVDAMSSLMEPLIMVVLGTLVGGLVVAMYLPIFKMGTAV